jgi:hypothetical protein
VDAEQGIGTEVGFMRRFSWKLAIVSSFIVVVPCTPASAGILDDHRIELRPPMVAIEKLFPNEVSSIENAYAPLGRIPLDFTPSWKDEEEASGPLRFELPDQPPVGLDLEIRYERFLFLTSAEMVTGTTATFSPRLDCDTRETYFWCRLAYDVDEHFTVFVESFQAAGSILGWDKTRAYQAYVWDGFQLELGARLNVDERFFVEGGPVLYTLSATQKPSSLGARAGLGVRF